jgi:5-methylcytosine-specific restriction endonuclease McrA
VGWLRVGDTFATDERVLAMGSTKDPNQLNEATGFVLRCAAEAASRNQDFISDGVTALIGVGRAAFLSRVAHRAGLFAERVTRNGLRGWKLVDDAELLHIRLQSERDWEAAHRALLRDPEVYLPVRLRDGDACRYCARIVKWKDTKSARGGTLDHVIPDGHELVVACKGCNSRKQDRTLADAGMDLLPPPHDPFYSPHTLDVFARYGITNPRPGSQPDPALLIGDPAASRTPHTRPGSQPDTATDRDPARPDTASTPRPATPADTAPTKHRPSADQPGRGQPDQAPSGRDGHGSGAPALPPQHSRDGPARRKPRGRRGRSTPPAQHHRKDTR